MIPPRLLTGVQGSDAYKNNRNIAGIRGLVNRNLRYTVGTVFDQLLIHRADIERRDPGVRDRFNQRTLHNIVAGSDVPCRITRGVGGRVNTERSIGVFEVQHEIFFKPDADVNEDDLLTVVDLDGYTILPPAVVQQTRVAYAGLDEPHHLEVIVLVQRGEKDSPQ